MAGAPRRRSGVSRRAGVADTLRAVQRAYGNQATQQLVRIWGRGAVGRNDKPRAIQRQLTYDTSWSSSWSWVGGNKWYDFAGEKNKLDSAFATLETRVGNARAAFVQGIARPLRNELEKLERFVTARKKQPVGWDEREALLSEFDTKAETARQLALQITQAVKDKQQEDTQREARKNAPQGGDSQPQQSTQPVPPPVMVPTSGKVDKQTAELEAIALQMKGIKSKEALPTLKKWTEHSYATIEQLRALVPLVPSAPQLDSLLVAATSARVPALLELLQLGLSTPANLLLLIKDRTDYFPLKHMLQHFPNDPAGLNELLAAEWRPDKLTPLTGFGLSASALSKLITSYRKYDRTYKALPQLIPLLPNPTDLADLLDTWVSTDVTSKEQQDPVNLIPVLQLNAATAAELRSLIKTGMDRTLLKDLLGLGRATPAQLGQLYNLVQYKRDVYTLLKDYNVDSATLVPLLTTHQGTEPSLVVEAWLVRDRWDKSTFATPVHSILYHYHKHVKNERLNKTIAQYTSDAETLYTEPGANRSAAEKGGEKVLSRSGSRGGNFSDAGQIYTFWYV